MSLKATVTRATAKAREFGQLTTPTINDRPIFPYIVGATLAVALATVALITVALAHHPYHIQLAHLPVYGRGDPGGRPGNGRPGWRLPPLLVALAGGCPYLLLLASKGQYQCIISQNPPSSKNPP